MKEKAGITVALLTGLGLFLFLALGRKRIISKSVIEDEIIRQAKSRNLDPSIALLFADLESGIKNVTGDYNWPDNSENWKKVIRNYPGNPYLKNRKLWISYGPFQLLAVWHLKKLDSMASPEILGNLKNNVKIGVSVIKNLEQKYNGDLLQMRMAYSCGTPSSCPESKAILIAQRLQLKVKDYNISVGSNLIARAKRLSTKTA